MGVSLLSDGHGNDLAFEVAEADIDQQRVNQIVRLGDVIQDGRAGTHPYLS